MTAGANSPSDVWAFAAQINGVSRVLHYAAGKLTPVALPGKPRAISVVSVSRVPGTRAQLASGSAYKAAQPGVSQAAVIPMYS